MLFCANVAVKDILQHFPDIRLSTLHEEASGIFGDRGETTGPGNKVVLGFVGDDGGVVYQQLSQGLHPPSLNPNLSHQVT